MNYGYIADEIKNTLTMRQVAQAYGFNVDRAGFMPCPFHGENTASLKVYDGKKGFWCFGCNMGGSIIDFVSKLYGLGFKAAVDKLNADFNLGYNMAKPLTTVDRKRISQIEEERRRKEEQQSKIKATYFSLFDEFIVLDYIRHNLKPKSENEPILDEYAYAVKWLPYIEYLLDQFSVKGGVHSGFIGTKNCGLFGR